MLRKSWNQARAWLTEVIWRAALHGVLRVTFKVSQTYWSSWINQGMFSPWPLQRLRVCPITKLYPSSATCRQAGIQLGT